MVGVVACGWLLGFGRLWLQSEDKLTTIKVLGGSCLVCWKGLCGALHCG